MNKKPQPPGFGLSARWVKKEANAQPCVKCQEPIYGNRYEHETTVFLTTEITGGPLCESCYLVVVKPEG